MGMLIQHKIWMDQYNASIFVFRCYIHLHAYILPVCSHLLSRVLTFKSNNLQQGRENKSISRAYSLDTCTHWYAKVSPPTTKKRQGVPIQRLQLQWECVTKNYFLLIKIKELYGTRVFWSILRQISFAFLK